MFSVRFLFRGCLLTLTFQLHAKYGLKGKKRKVFGDEFVRLGFTILKLLIKHFVRKTNLVAKCLLHFSLQHLCDPTSIFRFVEMLDSCVMLLRSWSCGFPFSLSRVHTSSFSSLLRMKMQQVVAAVSSVGLHKILRTCMVSFYVCCLFEL